VPTVCRPRAGATLASSPAPGGGDRRARAHQVFDVNVAVSSRRSGASSRELVVDDAVERHIGVKFSPNGSRMTLKIAARTARADYIDLQCRSTGPSPRSTTPCAVPARTPPRSGRWRTSPAPMRRRAVAPPPAQDRHRRESFGAPQKVVQNGAGRLRAEVEAVFARVVGDVAVESESRERPSSQAP
jgi:hypothetical protein